MFISFANNFQSEWLKKRRSLASWLVFVGAFFTPSIIILARLFNHASVKKLYLDEKFWEHAWNNAWESMAIFLLPLGIILSASLLTQLEYKNNTWKQLHTLPTSFTIIFFSKLLVMVLMIVQFLLLFNLGIYFSVLIPYLLISDVPYPTTNIPHLFFFKENALFFIDCLPIIAAQYLLSLLYKNFLVPVGIGFIIWVGSLASLSWKFGYLIPYTYCSFNYLKGTTVSKAVLPTVNFHYHAFGYFILFTIMGYILYLNKKDKG